jgi:ferric-dicitrate binding protein FerR (iron transport regulator)
MNQPAKPAFRQISTSKGQRTQFTLSDSTHVKLAAASRLKIPADYGVHSRKVYLQGQAFFEVKHNAAHPFTVIVNHHYIRDVGTHFNIKAYDSTQTEVAVSEGKIAVGMMKQGRTEKPEARLSSGMVAELKAGGDFTVNHAKNMNRYIGWTKGELVFHNTPLAAVSRELERWFGVTIKIKDSALKKRTLTADYDNLPMPELLRVLSLSMHISYSRHKGLIVFRDKT